MNELYRVLICIASVNKRSINSRYECSGLRAFAVWVKGRGCMKPSNQRSFYVCFPFRLSDKRTAHRLSALVHGALSKYSEIDGISERYKEDADTSFEFSVTLYMSLPVARWGRLCAYCISFGQLHCGIVISTQ